MAVTLACGSFGGAGAFPTHRSTSARRSVLPERSDQQAAPRAAQRRADDRRDVPRVSHESADVGARRGDVRSLARTVATRPACAVEAEEEALNPHFPAYEKLDNSFDPSAV